MRTALLSVASASIAASLALAACGNGDDTVSPVPVVDAGVDATKGASDAGGAAPQDAGTADATLYVAPSSGALIRFANWSADSPGVDFCIAPHGTVAYEGPVLMKAAAAIDVHDAVDAGPPALVFPNDSQYIVVPPGQYDAIAVAAGSPDCSTPITGRMASLPPLPTGVAQTVPPVLLAGSQETIALIGVDSPGANQPDLQIGTYLDDVTNNLGGPLFRIVNATPDPGAPDLITGQVGSVVLSSIVFGASSASAPDAAVDTNGYVKATLNAATVTVYKGNGAGLYAASGLTVMAASGIVTLVAVGNLDGGQDQVVECVDNGTATNSAMPWLGDCQTLP